MATTTVSLPLIKYERECDGYVAKDALVKNLGVDWSRFVGSDAASHAMASIEAAGLQHTTAEGGDIERLCPQLAHAARVWALLGTSNISRVEAHGVGGRKTAQGAVLTYKLRSADHRGDKFSVMALWNDIPEKHRRYASWGNARAAIKRCVLNAKCGGRDIALLVEFGRACVPVLFKTAFMQDNSVCLNAEEILGDADTRDATAPGWAGDVVHVAQTGPEAHAGQAEAAPEAASSDAVLRLVAETSTHTRFVDKGAGVERRALDGYIKWKPLALKLADKEFRFVKYVATQEYEHALKGIEKAFVGAACLPTWVHVHLAVDVARRARAPEATISVLEELQHPRSAAPDCMATTSEAWSGDLTSHGCLTELDRVATPPCECSPALRLQPLDFSKLHKIRRVPEGATYPGYGSCLDLIKLMTGKEASHVADAWRSLEQENASWLGNIKLGSHQFPGQGQRQTPVVHMSDMFSVAMRLPGNGRNVQRHALALNSFLSGARHENDNEMEALLYTLRSAMAAKQDVPGYLYAVTAARVDMVKAGRWSGTISKLVSRYKMVYGRDIQIWTFPVPDTKHAEDMILKGLNEWNLSGELFRKDGLPVILKMMEQVSTRSVIGVTL